MVFPFAHYTYTPCIFLDSTTSLLAKVLVRLSFPTLRSNRQCCGFKDT